MHCHVLSDHPLVYTLLNSNRGWVHKWLFSGEQHGPSQLLLGTPPQTHGGLREPIKALIDNTRGAVSSWFWTPINRFNQCHLNSADTGATGFSTSGLLLLFHEKHCQGNESLLSDFSIDITCIKGTVHTTIKNTFSSGGRSTRISYLSKSSINTM